MCDPFRNQFFGSGFFPPAGACCGPVMDSCGCKNKCDFEYKPKKSKKFVAELTGCQEIPRSCSKAVGTLVALLSPCNTKLDYVLQTSGLFGITAAHFHVGGPDCNGPIVKRIEINPYTGDAIGCWTCNDCEPLTPDLVCKLKNGEIYVNVHTCGMPNGEIRGQVEILKVVNKCKN